MILIRVDSNNRVTCFHENPDSLTDEQKTGGIFVDSIPEATPVSGKNIIYRYNEETNTVSLEYVDKVSAQTAEEKQRLEDVEDLIAELLGGE